MFSRILGAFEIIANSLVHVHARPLTEMHSPILAGIGLLNSSLEEKWLLLNRTWWRYHSHHFVQPNRQSLYEYRYLIFLLIPCHPIVPFSSREHQ